jgi:ABC-type uncharacterized transport system substrate-binding protein
MAHDCANKGRSEAPLICRCRRRPSTSLVVNLKNAKALGLDLATSVLARADEVIE